MPRQALRWAVFALAVFGLDAGAASAADIRIGLLLAGGRYASISDDIAAGASLALAEHGGRVAGRRIEFLREDAAAQPADVTERAQRLIDLGADILVGPATAREIAALRDVADASRVPLVVPTPGASALAGVACSPYALYLTPARDQVAGPLGSWAAAQRPAKRVYLLAPDEAAAREQVAAFRRQYEAAGGEVLGEEYVPASPDPDFSPYFAKLRLVGADALYAPFSADAELVLARDLEALGLAKSVALLGAGDSPTDRSRNILLAAGSIGAVDYSVAIDTPENRKFQAAFIKQFGRVPSSAAARGYDSGRLIVEALVRTEGRSEDHIALAAALARVSFTGPRGPVRADPQRSTAIDKLYIVRSLGAGDDTRYEVLDRVTAPPARLCAPRS